MPTPGGCLKINVELSVILSPKVTDNSTLIMAVPLGGTARCSPQRCGIEAYDRGLASGRGPGGPPS
jgi:hypothetical protein